MPHGRTCVLFLLIIAALSWTACANADGPADFRAADGIWVYEGKPYNSTSAHAIFHKFRTDREGAIEDLKKLKETGFNVVEAYWQWGKDLDPATNTFSFEVFDDFVLTSKSLGLATFCMFQEYVPIWLADKYGWGHTSEEGNRDVRVDDFYVCDPTFVAESKRFYVALIEHLKQRPDVSSNILYWNMGGEYKPFRPHRQPKPLDYGYDRHTVGAFRKWLAAKGWTLSQIAARWGAPKGAYSSWDDVEPAVNLKNTDYKGRPLSNIGAARWDWYDFRQEVAWQHMADAIRWVREAGDNRPMIHEYNIITPGGVVPFMRWSRVGARPGKDGIYQSSGTFDREFDYASLLSNLAICRGASAPPWQSNEQKGNTSPEWMTKHAWLLLAMGGTGMHFWEWRSDGWGVVKSDGSPGEGYCSAVRLNAQFDFLGELLAGSKPMPNRIGILALSEETFYAPWAHSRETNLILRALLEHGSGCEVAIITDDEVLYEDISGYRLIISPGQEHMRSSVREKLAEFVKNGGTLWLTPGSAEKNELDQPNAAIPGAPLDKAAGAIITGKRAAVIGRTVSGKEASEPYAMLERVSKATTAKPVAFLEKAGGEPVLYRNVYGRGLCYLQTGSTAYPPGEDTPLVRDAQALAYYIRSNCGQLPTHLIATALEEQGIAPYVKAFDNTGTPLPMVMTGIRRATPGYLIIIVEGDNRRTEVNLKLNAKRLNLRGAWTAYSPITLEECEVAPDWTLRTSLAPAEVKVLHLLPAGQAPRWIKHFADRDWSGIQAKLPPIPHKELIPPSEVGKVDPGDLQNVKPQPYGDKKWLLVDLSKHANRSLVDEGEQENAKAFLGSVGVGDNDLKELPKGIQELVGIPFNILDPETNINSCLITKTVGRPWLGPLEFTGIPVREKVRKIHWLYGSGWAPFDLPVGYITYHYSDGTRDYENLVCGKNIMNWWGRAEEYESEKLKLAWSGNTPAAARNFTTVGLYHYAWDNPHPEKVVESIDITSYSGDACIIVVAITAEK